MLRRLRPAQQHQLFWCIAAQVFAIVGVLYRTTCTGTRSVRRACATTPSRSPMTGRAVRGVKFTSDAAVAASASGILILQPQR